MKRYVCLICGYIYDEAVQKVKFSDLPQDWKCPLCGASKSAFSEVKENVAKAPVGVKAEPPEKKEKVSDTKMALDMKELSFGELSALCSNLAKGCEKQYLTEESGLFMQLADYYKSKTILPDDADFTSLLKLANQNLNEELSVADAEAQKASDRGAKRVLLWNRKVTTMLKALLERYEKEGDSMLENTNVYVCEICGFIYIGDTPPAICPVCKVPSFKILQVRRNA